MANNAFHVKYALKIIIHQLRICQQNTTKISAFETQFGPLGSTPLGANSTKPKFSNLSYKNIVNHYLDEDTVTPEENLPVEKWTNGCGSDIDVESAVTRATREAHEREKESTDGQFRFLRSGYPPIPLKERDVQLKLARKIHGKRRSKKNLEDLYEDLASG